MNALTRIDSNLRENGDVRSDEKNTELVRRAMMGSEQEIRNLVVSSCKMGDACYAQNKLEEAQKYYLIALKRAQQLYEQSENLYDRVETLPIVYEKNGLVCCCLNSFQEAFEYYRAGLELRQKALGMLQEKSWVTGTKRRIALICRQMVSICEETGDKEKIVRYCREGLTVSAELYNSERTEEDGRFFVTFAQRLGSLAYLEDNIEPAFRYFQDALTVRRQLQDEDGDVRTREELAANYEFLGHIYFKKGDYQKAGECYEWKFEIHRRLYEEQPTVDNYGKCAWAYYHLSTVLDDAGEYNCLKNAIAILEDIMERFPEKFEAEYRGLGMNCLGKLQRFQR
ncbi:MAG TPA: hypothetical protein DCZ91_13360 [Lachnospiraceae bacterium]|nr:hypothetical protein [Lachnospiraceae bacterium]